MTLLQDIAAWLWRLLPANPIVVRVVSTGGKRTRHLHARWLYLVVLFVVMLVVGGNGALNAGTNSLADLAKKSTRTFMFVSFVQLFLMSFIAPIFMAGAITQEKDSNTFHILLTTPLSTGQIVLGSLFSRLFFVLVLLLSGLPIFCITMIYGGVTLGAVLQSFGLAACTALVTGALAIMISFMKVGTRRTIFSFFLGVAVYLLVVGVLGWSGYTALSQAPLAPGASLRMSYLAPLHPFLALLVVTGKTPAPAAGDVAGLTWPAGWLMAYPQYGYMVIMTLASIVMVTVSIFFVRSSQKEGEATLLNRVRAFFTRRDAVESKTQTPRRVWNNPIAWREAKTKASASGRSMLRWAFAAAGLIGGFVLLLAHENGWWGFVATKPQEARYWLTGIVWIEMAVLLIIITNAAATALTREKESATMELLLTTRLTSKYIVAGILRGLVSFILPLIAVPTVTLLLFAIADLRRASDQAVITPEAFLLAPLLLLSFCALAAMIGLHLSLHSKKTVQAVMISTVIVLAGAGLLSLCGFAVSSGGGADGFIGAAIRPLMPFTGISTLIDYESVFDLRNGTPSAGARTSVRLVRAVSTLLAVVVYCAATWSVYTTLVRNFDMTVRRQSA